MAFKDKEEFLDGLWEHMGLEDNDEDNDFFDHVVSFFDQFDKKEENQSSTSPRRKRQSQSQSQSTTSRRRSRSSTGSNSGYGNSTFFGN